MQGKSSTSCILDGSECSGRGSERSSLQQDFEHPRGAFMEGEGSRESMCGASYSNRVATWLTMWCASPAAALGHDDVTSVAYHTINSWRDSYRNLSRPYLPL